MILIFAREGKAPYKIEFNPQVLVARAHFDYESNEYEYGVEMNTTHDEVPIDLAYGKEECDALMQKVADAVKRGENYVEILDKGM